MTLTLFLLFKAVKVGLISFIKCKIITKEHNSSKVWIKI